MRAMENAGGDKVRDLGCSDSQRARSAEAKKKDPLTPSRGLCKQTLARSASFLAGFASVFQILSSNCPCHGCKSDSQSTCSSLKLSDSSIPWMLLKVSRSTQHGPYCSGAKEMFQCLVGLLQS